MHVRISETLPSFIKKLYQSCYQAGSQEFFKAFEILWNKGVLINILSTSQKIFHRENLRSFCPRYCKSCSLNAKINLEMGKSGYFLDSWKELPFLSPLVAHLVIMPKLFWCNHHYRCVKTISRFIGKLLRMPGKLDSQKSKIDWKVLK